MNKYFVLLFARRKIANSKILVPCFPLCVCVQSRFTQSEIWENRFYSLHRAPLSEFLFAGNYAWFHFHNKLAILFWDLPPGVLGRIVNCIFLLCHKPPCLLMKRTSSLRDRINFPAHHTHLIVVLRYVIAWLTGKHSFSFSLYTMQNFKPNIWQN